MKQRIVIAIALACEPKLILADEPTTALDVTIQAQMLGMIPDPSVKIEGCRFAQRCKFATQRCKADPGMIQVAPDHMIRCHLFDKRTEG